MSPEELKAFRAKYGLSQVALAKYLQTEQTVVSRWELGKHSMGKAYMQLIAALGERLDREQAAAPKDQVAAGWTAGR